MFGEGKGAVGVGGVGVGSSSVPNFNLILTNRKISYTLPPSA